MKPYNLKTKIFLDGGDPEETKLLIKELEFLDGQTTNPTLISKNPEAQKRLTSGDKFTKDEIMDFYKNVVSQISAIIPEGSVSIEVYADDKTTASEMMTQARRMNEWIPNAHIKFPTTKAGLMAAEDSVKRGMSVNMTLVFTQEQAAAVYAATRGAIKGQVFVSPFVGRLDDIGENGMDLIKNILKMYQGGDGHVEVLTASVRSLEHYNAALTLGTDIITGPYKLTKDWASKGRQVQEDYTYAPKDLKQIEFKEIDLRRDWQEFDINHELTDAGIEKFASDWNALIK